jgi:sigma-B regulation protein RsbU (phosphoserine phosphatase)
LDPAGRIVRLNRTLADWLGIDAAATCGEPLYDLLPISGRMYFETHLKPLLRMQGFVNEVDLELVKSDGARLPVIANGLERRDPSGRLLFTRITLFLAVERRRYERNLLAARDAAEAAGEQSRTQEIVTRSELAAERSTAELRDQFIAVLGHDLRNPLASISGAARLLRKEPLSPRGFSIIGMMEDSVGRMNRLIEDVLDFARGKLGGGLALATTEQDLEPVLQQVVSEFQTGTTDQVIQTEFALDRPMRFDASRMGQMISNLLGNAITHGDRSQPIRIRATTIDDTLEITVANGGEPIPYAA